MSCSSASPPLTPPTSDSENEGPPSHPPETSRPQHSLIKHSMPHPFAASTKADRDPPAYEKKLVTPPATPPDSRKPVPPPSHQVSELKAQTDEHVTQTLSPSPSSRKAEQRRWDVAISSAVDTANPKLDLSSGGLTYIPPSIIDLKNLVVLSKRAPQQATSHTRIFARSTTAPALLPSPHLAGTRPFLPSRSTNRLALGAGRQEHGRLSKALIDPHYCEVELYLMRNAIRILPRELFALDCLVVLSLRQNKLTLLPPAIGQLTRLRELNVANNRLTYLPAEIQNLRLASLHLHPNSFTPSPKNDATDSLTRTLGSLTRGVLVPSLSELVLRYLLAPSTSRSQGISQSQSESRLEAAMTLAQIDALSLPAHIRRIVNASTAHGQARVNLDGAGVDAAEDMTRNVCPCPWHRGPDVIAHRGKGPGRSVRFMQDENIGTRDTFARAAPVFRVPVEERIEWVNVVAGVQVAESPGNWVPLLWRGCSKGCLDFLGGEDVTGREEEDEPLFETGTGEEGEEFEFSDRE